ncbi:unnamed protein product, partial [marine sediment metagenome]
MVEAHYYVSTQPILDFCCDFGIQVYSCPIYVAGKLNAIITDFSQGTQRKDLVATTV